MIDVIVIGAGQAGLAVGYYLKQAGLKFIMLDDQSQVGDSWRNRYDSLRLFTPRRYDSLPGLDFPEDPEGLPTKNEVAEYLTMYAEHHELPIESETKVRQLKREHDSFVIVTDTNTYYAKQVVIATGPFQTPVIPSYSSGVSDQVVQFHSSHYQNASQLQQGVTLVVGAGNSGAHIASELTDTHEVHLSAGSNIHYKPLTITGKSIFWYYDKLGLIQSDKASLLGRLVKKQPEQIYGFDLNQKITQGHVHLHPRTIGVDGDEVFFENGSSLVISNIVWATGYKRNDSWILIDGVIDEKEKVIHKAGQSNIDGLFFVGLPWQTCRGSALLGWVKYDAEKIVSAIQRRNREHNK
jgi:putative flavoprotein involved in K+ transport